MAVPKKKTSKSKRDMRRSHHFLTPRFGVVCSDCGGTKQRHRACPECGSYKGRQVVANEA